SAGCHDLTKRDLQRLIRQPVCPVCKAVSIGECHCFHGAEHAGYCETSWTSLDPELAAEPSGPGSRHEREGVPVEELPSPQSLLEPAKAQGRRGTGPIFVTDAALPASGGQSVAHAQRAPQVSPGDQPASHPS